jgi:Glycosyl transferase family 2
MTQYNYLRNILQRFDIKIHLHALCWNEERMLPYFFRHYDPLIARYFIYDNGSTDRSIEMLTANRKVTLDHFEVRGDSFVEAARDHYDQCWKQSRGRADWVIVCNIDEHIYHPDLKGYLRDCKRQGISLINAAGYHMVSDTFPKTNRNLSEVITYGVRDMLWNKPQLLDPDKIDEINFTHGRHSAEPTGEVTVPEKQEVKLLHFKYLGPEYLVRRHGELRTGLKSRDIAMAWGHHYLRDEHQTTEEYQRVKSQAERVL